MRLLSVSALLLPAVAWAADAPGVDVSRVLALIIGAGMAYLLVHFVLERVQEAFLVVTGVEFVLFGVLLGRAGVLQPGPELSPIVAFTAGWVGLVTGTGHRLRSLGSTAAARVGLLDALVVAGTVAVPAALFLEARTPRGTGNVWLVALVLGCAAAATSTSAPDLVARRHPRLEGGLLEVLTQAGRLGEVLAILAFGVLLSAFHADTGVALGPSDWVLVTLSLGAGLGWLFGVFVGDDAPESERFLALVGILCLATGAAFYLELSAITVNLGLGAVLASAPGGDDVHETLARWRRPVVLLMLVLAGALWAPVPAGEGVAAVCGLLALRWAGKAVAGWLAAVGTPLRRDLSRGTLAQGDVALAIAVSFQLVFDGPLVDLAYTAMLASILVNELIAPRLLKGLLVDAGALRQDTELPASSVGG